MNKEILKAQLDLYKKGKEQALAAFEKVKADINSFNGAIEACEHLLEVEEGLEKPGAETPEKEKEV